MEAVKKSRRTWFGYLVSKMPPFIMDPIIRRWLNVPLFAFDPRLSVQIAKTKEDLEASFKLLYRCYREDRLYPETPSGMKVNLFSLLPDTTTVVVKFEGEVVGTVSLFRDSKFGLYTDSEYEAENNQVRAARGRPVEVSALAVDPQFRAKGHAISFLLMKFIYWYARFWMHGTHFVCSVRTRNYDFYRALFGFKRFGSVVSYRGAGGVLAVYLRMELSSKHTARLIRIHPTYHRSLTSFFLFQPDHRLQFPKHTLGQALDPAITPELLHYFGVEKTRALFDLPVDVREQLLLDYQMIFGDLGPLSHMLPPDKRLQNRGHYRLNVHLDCLVVTADGTVIEGTIENLSTYGCFISLPEGRVLSHGDKVSLEFRNSNQILQVAAEVRWRHSNGKLKHLGEGHGFHFDQPQHLIEQFLAPIVASNKKAA